MADKKRTIYFGSDREGYELKKDLEVFLQSKGYDMIDLGLFKDDDIGFDNIVREVQDKVSERENSLGVVFFGRRDKVEKSKKDDKQS